MKVFVIETGVQYLSNGTSNWWFDMEDYRIITEKEVEERTGLKVEPGIYEELETLGFIHPPDISESELALKFIEKIGAPDRVKRYFRGLEGEERVLSFRGYVDCLDHPRVLNHWHSFYEEKIEADVKQWCIRNGIRYCHEKDLSPTEHRRIQRESDEFYARLWED